jgi:hypothetical protein
MFSVESATGWSFLKPMKKPRMPFPPTWRTDTVLSFSGRCCIAFTSHSLYAASVFGSPCLSSSGILPPP